MKRKQILEEYNKFLESSGSNSHSTEQKRHIRRVFYAGVISAMRILTEGAANPDMSPEVLEKRMTDMVDELQVFGREISEGRS